MKAKPADASSAVRPSDHGGHSAWEIERRGLEWVADADRRGTPRGLFWPWAAPNINVIIVAFGMYAAAFGVGWLSATIAAAIGTVLSFVLVGLASLAGQQGGVPTMVTSRAAFGHHGNKVPAVLSYLVLVGWETVGAVLSTLAAKTVVLRLNPGIDPKPIMVVTFLTVIVGSTLVGVYGLHVILRVQKWLTIVFTALTGVYLVLTMPRISFSVAGHFSWAGFAGVVGFAAALFGLGWVNCAADYSRYLPRTASRRGVVGWTTFGGSAAPVLLLMFGILLAAGDPAIAEEAVTDPVGALTAHLPTWFLIPYLTFAVLSFVSSSIMDLYSSGLVLLAIGVRLPRRATVLIDAGLVALGGGYVAFAAPTFFAPFQAFLSVVGVPVAAWTGIFLVDLWQRRRHGYDQAALYDSAGAYGRINKVGVGSLIPATAVGLGLVTSQDPHIGPLLGYLFTQAARNGSLGTSNLGVFVALGLAALTYALAHRVTDPGRNRSHLATGPRDDDRPQPTPSQHNSPLPSTARVPVHEQRESAGA
ncbi:purine-cytosine permease family protein [Nocardia sp. NPDC059091]|uniref:purine-cytosine permease family protein n=1 Tax=Nocardia sp. NPDC059091 TaxID=3346724 RepID=UPI0036962045